MASENEIDTGDGTGQNEIILELFVADHDDDIRVLLLAQIADRITGSGDRISEMEQRLFDESLEIASRDRNPQFAP